MYRLLARIVVGTALTVASLVADATAQTTTTAAVATTADATTMADATAYRSPDIARGAGHRITWIERSSPEAPAPEPTFESAFDAAFEPPLDDPDLEPGFPVDAVHTAGSYHAGPAIHTLVMNLDPDPELEIVASAPATGPVYAWNHDGTLLGGWPVSGAGAGYAAGGVICWRAVLPGWWSPSGADRSWSTTTTARWRAAGPLRLRTTSPRRRR